MLTFNYDGNGNLLTITQAGRAQPLATFVWGTTYVGYNFSGLTSYGPDGTNIAVLTQVGLPDGSRFNFEYDNSYGMVSTVRQYAFDNRQRSYITYVAPASADLIPRVTQRKDWAEFWTGVNGVPSEVITTYAHDGDGACRLTAPDGTIYKEYYGSSWQSGLTTQSEVWSGGVKQKWTTIAWTQDNTAVSYLTNPRVMETNVYDAGGNRRRTTIDYGQYASYGLPNGVFEYQADGVSLLRVMYTDYNLNQAYLDRHIIGLVSAVHVSDGQWQSKTTYEYDTTAIDPQATAATMHDQNYHASFTARGNVTSVSRWDVTDIGNSNKRHTSTVTYNAAGSALSSTDPGIHTNTITYADSFSDGINRNTFAYPATVTDADNFSSTMQYNFESGAVTRTQGPPPTGQTQGAIQTMLYDAAGRIERVTTQNNSAYTRYVYGPYYIQSYSTVNTVADEAYAVQVFDGAGRVFGTANNHPGSVGGYQLVNTIYDQMGRLVQQSNPIEINNSWIPAGDDATGVYYTQQTYDWKARPLVTTNTDGTQKYASYGGCGCAGGEVVTLTDEVGRQQKVYSDVVGRQWKTEVLNLNGIVYSTTTNTFNGRDQVTLARQWSGAENGGGAYQDTTMTYDGYGRLQSKHVPEQNAGTATVYAYNSDGTVQSVTDARGASATYAYNNRHLVTAIDYSAPAGITPASNVTFGYDGAGNRTSMTDGRGSVSYAYNQLSRMTSETRTFTGLSNYTVGYDYNLAGQLKSITDPAGATINYALDSAGRLSAVTGSSFGGVTTYASGAQFRAWGGLKHLNYGNSRVMDAGYNTRMQASSFTLPGVMSKSYSYHADGQLSFSSDASDHRFDRSYSYDHAARITQAFSGAEARGEPATNNRPYKQTFSYDGFGHLANRNSHIWPDFYPSSDTYVNNRRSWWSYDAAGNLLGSDDAAYAYDAVGSIVTVSTYEPESTTTRSLDGYGQQVKTVASTYDENTESWSTLTKYYVRSTVLGKVITELDQNGAKQRTFVYAGSQMLATQDVIPFYGSQGVTWEHRDPSNATFRTTMVNGDVSAYAELDPTGADAGLAAPIVLPDPPDESNGGSHLPYPSFGSPRRPGTTYSRDGVLVPAEYFLGQLDSVFQGDFGLVESFARATQDDDNYRQRPYRGPVDPHDELAFLRTETTALPLYGSLDWLFGLEPQNTYDPRVDFRDYAKELSQNDKITDCLKLALMIYKAGQVFGPNSHDSGRGIMRGLMAGLTDWTAVNLGGREGPSDRNYRVGVYRSDPHYAGGFGDSGFARHFQDDSNQVRHFVFYLGAGYGLPQTAARYGLHREEGTNNPRVADVGLGWVGIDLGNHFDGNYRQLAQDVWRRVCGQSSSLNLP